MNKDKIREIRNEWGPKSSIRDLCDALLEEDDIKSNVELISPKLLLCPACGGEAELSDWLSGVICGDIRCNMTGPVKDHGEKWNALPRHNDLAYGMHMKLAKEQERQRWIDTVRGNYRRPYIGVSIKSAFNALLRDMGVEE